MTEINLVIDGPKGDAVKGFAALAGKTVDQLILSWIEDQVNHAVVVAMRAGGATWDAVASELGTSITQARRIYAAGSEFRPISRDDTKAAEKYLKLLEEIRDITCDSEIFPVPTQDDLSTINEYLNALPDPDGICFPVPTQNVLDIIGEYANALPDVEDIHFPIPSEEDLEAVERYAKATNKE